MKDKKKEYVHLYYFYIQRKLLITLLIAGSVALFTIFQQDITNFLDHLFGNVPIIATFNYNDKALASYEGQVRILNSNQKVIYEGMYMDGACNGKGTIYDGVGHIVYQGELTQNVMQDDHGKLYYENGTLAYTGQIQNNQKEGTGIQYREDGSLQYEGEFALDSYGGYGKEYDEEEQLIYEGDFLDGNRHGVGKSYEHSPRKRMLYEGDFAFGKPQGKGTFYDKLGKAYYTGAVYQGHMDLTSFLPSTLQDLENSFLTPYDVYAYQMQVMVDNNGKQESKTVVKTAIVYPLHNLVFFTQYPIMFDQSKESWSMSKDVDKSNIYIESIEMVDANIDDPTLTFMRESVEKAWSTRATSIVVEKKMDYFDVFALYFSSNATTTLEKKNVTITAHGNRIYEMSYQQESQNTTRTMYKVTDYSVGYGYPIDHNRLLYSLLMNEHREVTAK